MKKWRVPPAVEDSYLRIAMDNINIQGVQEGRDSVYYYVEYLEKYYPPKFVIDVAYRFAKYPNYTYTLEAQPSDDEYTFDAWEAVLFLREQGFIVKDIRQDTIDLSKKVKIAGNGNIRNIEVIEHFEFVEDKATIDRYADIIDKLIINDLDITANKKYDALKGREFNIPIPQNNDIDEEASSTFTLHYNRTRQQTCFLVRNGDEYYLARNGRGGGYSRGGGFKERHLYYLEHTENRCITIGDENLALVAQFNSPTLIADLKESSYEMDRLLLEMRAPNLTIEELKKKLARMSGDKHKNRLTKVRTFQIYFRALVIAKWQTCPFLELGKKKLLVASHIKPYKDCSNDECRDEYNGIPMTAAYDLLMDKGYISFDLDGKLMVSDQLSSEERERFNLAHFKSQKLIETKHREEFLDFHHKHVFKGKPITL